MENENSPKEYSIQFEEMLSRAQLERKQDPSITETAKFMFDASYFEENNKVFVEAREKLLKEDPRKLYLDCIKFLVKKINNSEKAERYLWVDRLYSLAIRGLGIKIDDLEFIGSDSKNIFRGEPHWDKIEKHIDKHVIGDSFIMKLDVPEDKTLWGDDFPLRISACDASQHRLKLTIPYFNKQFSTPIVVNNAAGIIKEKSPNKPAWQNIIVPKNTQDFENWVIIGIEDYTDLNPDDYDWATKCAMDVGQFYVEETYILPYGGLEKKPDVHLRDGTIFPQGKAMNCRLLNRHGKLLRESIWRMNNTLKRAKELGIIFCGMAKNVQLKVYSIVIDWYIREIMKDSKWNITGHVLSDPYLMRYLLYNPNFDGSLFKEMYTTCLIIRDYYTTSNLNARSEKQVVNDLASLEKVQSHRGTTARQIIEEALNYSVAMFFSGHTKTDEFFIPRYEFVYYGEDLNKTKENLIKILSALRLASFTLDQDHLRTLEEPIIVPIPVMLAHDLSKRMGNELTKNWKARTYSELARMKKESCSKVNLK